jgi:hypothetical protein
MNALAHPAVLVTLFAGIIGTLALAFAEEAKETKTPFQAMVPFLVTPSVPYEAEIIQADPERERRQWMDEVDRLEELSRLGLARSERPDGGVPFFGRPEVSVPSVPRVERPEPSVGLIRLDRVEKPQKVEKVERIEKPGKLEKVERVDRGGRR